MNCIETQCRKDRDGYGKIWDSQNKKHKLHHRYVWEQHNGAIPQGQVVRHKCDNPSCIRIDHLELGTHKDNMCDRAERNRTAKGEQHGHSKFTEAQVKEIRSLKGVVTAASLARKYGVDPVSIHNIQKGVTWKHI